MTKVAIVTGSNRGIGYGIVKGLAKTFDGVVYLTARDEAAGKNALNKLKKEDLNVNFHQLDITNLESVKKFASYIKDKYNGFDILINNAGFAYPGKTDVPISKQAEDSMSINYFGTLNMCNEFFPLLKPHARVVHISGRLGMLKCCKDRELRAILASDNSSIDDINTVMNKFIEAAKNGTSEKISTTCLGMSKCGLIAATRIQQKAFDKDSRPDIIVNACCPGPVQTALTDFRGRTIEEGAITPIFLALISKNADKPKGEFWAEKARIDWTDLAWQWPQTIIEAMKIKPLKKK